MPIIASINLIRMNNRVILKIAIPTPLRKLFDYLLPIPAQVIQPGMRVLVPFGNRVVLGLVVELASQSELPLNKLKRIKEVLDPAPLFSERLFQLLLWAADYYQYPLGEVLHQAMPLLLRQGKPAQAREEISWELTPESHALTVADFKRSPKQWQALVILRQLSDGHAQLPQRELQALDIKLSLLKVLEKKKLVKQIKTKHNRLESASAVIPITLADEQQTAVTTILEKVGSFFPVVLQGITGSGKTEVYLAVARELIKAGGQVLLLVPEIGLTPQTLARFKERLACPVVVMHSGLTDNERFDAAQLAKDGDVAVVVGTRSAIFTDFKNLRLIIVDECHDASYKQWEGFKYHAGDVAVRRAQLDQIPVILGSATPSVATLHNVALGRFVCLKLQLRNSGAVLPRYRVVDVRSQPLNNGLALNVLAQMEQHLDHGNQVLVFLNRRGFAPILMCHDCGWVDECERCRAAFTVHKFPPHLSCHHCGKTKPVAKQCVKCSGGQFIEIGLGTQRLEETLQSYFPDKKIARIDRDTTRQKGRLEEKLMDIHQGYAQILIGTQMLAKGHHFPNVTLVVLPDIDGGLYSADFMATERMAQLLVQVSGRAGRGEKAGEVLIQTHHPQNPLLQSLLEQGYDAFAQMMLIERQAAKLPPYTYFVLFRAESIQESAGEVFLNEVKVLLTDTQSSIKIMGPIQAPIEKRIGRYRWQLLLIADKRSSLHHILKIQLPTIEQLKSSQKVRWSVDVDPIDML
jgi:primosomal protein N' (replication factor Y)